MISPSEGVVQKITAQKIAAQKINWHDYLEMCKPKVILLMILTSVIGMMLARPELPSLRVLVVGNLGIALMAAAAAVINHVVDRKIDTLMSRTKNRPMANGRVAVTHAILFAGMMSVSGIMLLFIFINPITAWLTLVSLLGYAVVYTLFLKHATPQNIVIGGLAGAAPPLLGWTAVTGAIEPNSLLLVLIIFTWTPPHFWSLAIHRKKEYALAGVPMLPVTHGEAFTKLQILLYTFLLIVVSMLPFITRMSGEIYLIFTLILGARFLFWAVILYRDSRPHAAINTFHYSITYLMLLFLVLLLDHYITLPFSLLLN